MELISLNAACDAILKEYDDYPYGERACGLNDAVGIILDEVPTIPAVPLEPLAEWLAEYAAPPVSECCVTADERTAAWKAVLNKFVEEQDAVD